MPTSSSSDLKVPADHPETPDVGGAYPRLTDEQIMSLSRYGDRGACPRAPCCSARATRTAASSWCWTGRSPWSRRPTADPRLIAVHGPGRFLGDLSLLTGQAVYVTAVAATDVEVLEIPVDRLKEALAEDQTLGDLILRAFSCGARSRQTRRRPADHRLAFRPDTRRLRDFASRNRIPHRWVDLEEDRRGRGPSCAPSASRPTETPVVIWKGQRSCATPATPSWPS